MSDTQPFYRCYYDDGTIQTSVGECPATTEQGSPLISSELTLIEDVTHQMGWPWLLLILAMLVFSSDNKRR